MIQESLSKLNPLETFNKKSFIGDKEFNQDLCDFVLSLSLIWNDFKNLMLYLLYVRSLEPSNVSFNKPDDMPVSPIWGEISGTKIYIEKLLIALIHELFELIRESRDVVESVCFKKILRKLHKNNKKAWQIVLDYAHEGADSRTQLGKAILMVRHKITNHYDKRELFKGYSRKFIEGDTIPYISRGGSMLSQRFYFADASAQEYYRSFQEPMEYDKFYDNIKLITNSLIFSIKNIVETFIQMRSAWEKVK